MAKVVAPKKAALKEAEADLAVAMAVSETFKNGEIIFLVTWYRSFHTNTNTYKQYLLDTNISS